MIGNRKKINEEELEENMRPYQNSMENSQIEIMRRKIMEMEENLNISNQQIQVYQELEKLQKEEVFRYYLLRELQTMNKTLKGIGQNLTEVGKVLDEKTTSQIQIPQVKSKRIEEEPRKKKKSWIFNKKDRDEEDEDDSEFEEDDE